MTFAARNPFIAQFITQDFARVLVQGQQAPLMRILVVGRCDVAIKPHLHILIAGSDRGRDIDHISPDDGRRVRQAVNRRAPADVLPLLDIPVGGRRRAGIDAAGRRSAELGPIRRRGATGPKDSQANR